MKVLDKGYVELVDSMGSDQRVVDTARVSVSGPGVKLIRRDEKLIKYLATNKHYSPFEHVHFTFRIKAPLFVIRQWHRHRTWCLPADTDIAFQRPDNGSLYSKQLGDVVRSYNDPAQRERLCRMQLRVIDPETKEISTANLKSAWSVGKKWTYRVHTADGDVVRATGHHPFLTDMGWLELDEIRLLRRVGYPVHLFRMSSAGVKVPQLGIVAREEYEEWRPVDQYFGLYEVSSEGRVRSFFNTQKVRREEPLIKERTINSQGYYCVSLSRDGKSRMFNVHSLVAKAFLGDCPKGQCVRHKDGNRLNPLAENLAYGTPADNHEDMVNHGSRARLSAVPTLITDIEDYGLEEVFDLEVDSPHHSFFANRIAVHNCYNEQSARYGEMKNEFYLPEIDRYQAQSADNKQASGDRLAYPTQLACARSLEDATKEAMTVYRYMLGLGLARETARMVLPLNLYSTFYGTVNLRNLAAFIQLRDHHHAQWEIQEYARAMKQLAMDVAPVSVQALLGEE